MAKTVGFNLSIGAKMASSVGAVFDTVAGRAGKLKGDLKQLNTMSTAAGNVAKTGTKVAELRAQSSSGKDVKTSLAAAERAYASAQKTAAKYNITVADAAKIHAQTTAQIQRTGAALKRQENLMRNKSKRDELKGEMLGTVASAGMVVAPVKIAIDFESSMADAAKTIDGMRDDAGNLTADYYKMEAAVKNLGRTLPLTHNQIASLFAAGGQMGMTTAEELSEFATMSAHMSVAFGMGTEEAADAIGGFKTKLGMTNVQVREMLDLTNQFANTSSATEKDIAGIVSRVGALGDMAGISYKPMTAMAATLASMKIPEEIASTGLKNFMLTMSKGEAATKQQREAFADLGIDTKKLSKEMQHDAEGAMLAVLEKIKALPKYQQTAILTQLFGSESVGAIAPMLTQLELLKSNLLQAQDTAKSAGAMQKEFENRARTTANNLVITKNKMSEMAITAGTALLPALNDVLTTVGNGAVSLADFAQANPQVVSAVMYTVAALATLKVVTLAGSYAITGVSDAWQGVKATWAFATAMCRRSTYAMIAHKTVSIATAAGTRIMAVAQWGLNAALTANPIGLVVTGVALLAAGLTTLYHSCEPVKKAMDWLWDGSIEKVKQFLDWIKPVLDGIKKISSWVFSEDPAETEAKTKQNESIADAQAFIKAREAKGRALTTEEIQAISKGQALSKSIGSLQASVNAAQKTGTPLEADQAEPVQDTSLKLETKAAQVAVKPVYAQSPAVTTQAAPQKAQPTSNSPSQSEDAELKGMLKQGGPQSEAEIAAMMEKYGAPQPNSAANNPKGQDAHTNSLTTLAPSLQISIHMEGVTDRDFGKRVLESIQTQQSEIERFLSGLLKNQARVNYA